MPALDLTWWDGGLMPPRPAGSSRAAAWGTSMEDPADRDEGAIMAGCYGESPRIVPESLMKKYKRPRRTLERIPEGPDGHEQDWIRACKGARPATSNFDYSGPCRR